MNTPPPGYNAGESMLSGGTEPIVAVMGGGKKKRAQKGGINPFILKAPPISQDIPENIIDHKRKSIELTFVNTKLHSRLNFLQLGVYVKRMEALWQRRVDQGNAGASQYITMSAAEAANPIYDRDTGSTGQAGFDRLGIVLSNKITDIVVVPPIHGNIAVYNEYMENVNDYLRSDTAAIIFAAPFYAASSDIVAVNVTKAYNDNASIFQDFVARKINPATKASMYIMTEYTQNSIALGVAVTKAVAKSQRHIITLLEPTYIIYPYDCTLEGDKHSGIIFSAAANDEEHVPDSNISSKLGLISAANKSLPSVAWPPNTDVLDSNLASATLPYTLYTFLDSNAMNTAGHTFNIFSMTRPMTGGGGFISSASAIVNGVQYKDIILNGGIHRVRYPDINVINDWNKLLFIKSEIDMLAELDITKEALDSIYGNQPWLDEFVKSLIAMVKSECFIDYKMILQSECQAANTFLTKISNYLGKNITNRKPTKVVSDNGNPFEDGLIQTSNRPRLDPQIIEIVDRNEYRKDVEVTDPRSNISFGTIISKANSFKEADTDINAQYKALKMKYPGYSFKIEV